jgi:hypothetical protein
MVVPMDARFSVDGTVQGGSRLDLMAVLKATHSSYAIAAFSPDRKNMVPGFITILLPQNYPRLTSNRFRVVERSKR